MDSRKWVYLWFIFLLILPFVAIVNYVVDPYSIYLTDYLDSKKIMLGNKVRLVKAIRVAQIKPRSIILGTSRAEHGFDPDHAYFEKPSYNFALSASTIYEAKLSLLWALKQGNLKQVFLVADYRMFDSGVMKSTYDFENYFNSEKSEYSYLFSMDMLVDSIKTIAGSDRFYDVFLNNGQREQYHYQQYIDEHGGHGALMRGDSKYYKDFRSSYYYGDTGRNSFEDFDEILQICHDNNIKLEIIFGPSHVLQWEAIDLYVGFDNWLAWKKKVVLHVDNIAKQQGFRPYRVFDFSVYHKYTLENVPTNSDEKMTYHWESSHYKYSLGLIVLDILSGVSGNEGFGRKLNIESIDRALSEQRISRAKFVSGHL